MRAWLSLPILSLLAPFAVAQVRIEPPVHDRPGIPSVKGAFGTVAGTVLDAQAQGVDGVDVLALNAQGFLFGSGATITDGSYSFDVAPGAYLIVTRVGGPGGNDFLVDQISGGVTCLGGPSPALPPGCDLLAGTPVNVTSGQTVTQDFMLNEGGVVKGTIVEATTGFHTEFPHIHVFDNGGMAVAVLSASLVSSASSLTFESNALPPGSYHIVIAVPGFVPQLFPATQCPDVACDVTSGDLVTISTGVFSAPAVNVAISVDASAGGAMAGEVIGGGGMALGSVRVEALNGGGSVLGRALAFTLFGASEGGFAIAGLPPGTVYSRTRRSNLVDELFDNFLCEDDCEIARGTPITVAMGQITTGIDFVLGDGSAFPVPSTVAPGDRFGAAMDGSGGRLAVGQPNANGGSGQVVVFRRDGNQLVEEQTIVVPAGFFASGFGCAVDLDGDLLLIGAAGTDPMAKGPAASPLQAALLERVGQSWRMKHEYVTPAGESGDGFGTAVALLGGGTVAIGAPADAVGESGSGSGAVFVFDSEGAMLVKQKPLTASPGARFGATLAASGGRLGVGAPGGRISDAVGNSVSLFARVGQNLMASGLLRGSGDDNDEFGAAVALDGATVVVGAPGDDGAATDAGAAFAFQFDGGSLIGRIEPQTVQAAAGFGRAVALAGGDIAVGAPGFNGGVGRVYRFDPGLKQTLQLDPGAGDVEFGAAVALADGLLAVGAPGTGADGGQVRIQSDPDRVFLGNFE